jgi:hypothetical protein
MAMTRSSAPNMPMLPSPGRAQKASSPLACSRVANCQLSHSSDNTTSGRPKRLTKRRTSFTIEPASSASSTAPHSSVVSTPPQAVPIAAPNTDWPMACVPSRMTTSSKVVQPTSCTMFNSTGSRAKALP